MKVLQGKSAVISGGSKNLGSLISTSLADLGANILIHYHSDASLAQAEQTADKVRERGVQAELFQGDLTDPKQIAAMFDHAVKTFGSVEIAVNTVGQVLKKPFLEISEEEYDQMFAVNSKSGFFFIKEAGAKLSDGGKIISIATSLLAAFTGYYSVYAGSKSPLEHFTRAAAKEFGHRQISVNNVAPGPLDTPFFYPAESPEAVAYHKSASMNGELGKVEDIAPIVVFLATQGWWVTGQTIFANGGYTTR